MGMIDIHDINIEMQQEGAYDNNEWTALGSVKYPGSALS